MRAVLVLVALALAATGAAGCGPAGRAADGAAGGSTLLRTLGDPDRDGVLRPGPGEPLRPRTELAPRAPAVRTLATFAQLTDAHVRDEESPARVPFLDRAGPPFASTFRPQEALSAQVLGGAVRAVNAARPQAVAITGDLIDNDQLNELALALGVLRGGRVDPDSGAPGYRGPQEASDPDPFYYRPDVDPPRFPGLLARAQRPFVSPGLQAPWYPALGNHDVLVQGELAPDARTRAAAVGDRAVWEPPPDVPLGRAAIERVLRGGAVPGAVRVAPDARRRELGAGEVVARLRAAGALGGSGPLLDGSFDVGARVRGIVLDLIDRSGGDVPVLHPGQLAWLRAALRAAGRRWVVVFAHQPLERSAGGRAVLGVLARDPRVVAVVGGDTHRNRVRPWPGPGGGLWLITTASLADWPMQGRMFALRATAGGGVALDTWMLDVDAAGDPLADAARRLAFLDAQGGRPQGFAGRRADRNVRLFKRGSG